jgi:hypothetical protein
MLIIKTGIGNYLFERGLIYMLKQKDLLLSVVSEELDQILKDRFGYRNEGYGGSGEHNAFEVIKFEMCELANEDIVDFFKENYGLEVPFESYSDAWNNGELEDEDVDKIIDDMKAILEKKFGHTELFALWLTTLNGVKEHYTDEDLEYVNKYFFSDGLVIPISDLGDQGTLFIMAVNPDHLKFEEVAIQ